MLGAIRCLEQAYGKGFLSSYTRARISSLKAQGLSGKFHIPRKVGNSFLG